MASMATDHCGYGECDCRRSTTDVAVHDFEQNLIDRMKAGEFGDSEPVLFSSGKAGNLFQVVFRDNSSRYWIANFSLQDGSILSSWRFPPKNAP